MATKSFLVYIYFAAIFGFQGMPKARQKATPGNAGIAAVGIIIKQCILFV